MKEIQVRVHSSKCNSSFSMASNFLSSSLLSSGFPEEVQWLLLSFVGHFSPFLLSLHFGLAGASCWVAVEAIFFLRFFSNYFYKGEVSSSSDEFWCKPEINIFSTSGLPLWSSGWESPCQCMGHRFDPWSRRDPTSLGTAKLVGHGYWTCALEPLNHNY